MQSIQPIHDGKTQRLTSAPRPRAVTELLIVDDASAWAVVRALCWMGEPAHYEPIMSALLKVAFLSLLLVLWRLTYGHVAVALFCCAVAWIATQE